jgi:hypothetical protein
MRNTHKNHGFGFFENGSKGEVKKQDQVKSSLPSPSAGQFSAISAINEFVGGLQIQNDGNIYVDDYFQHKVVILEEILIDFNEDPYLSPPSNQLGSLLLEPLSSEIPMAHTIPETKCGNTKNVSLKMKNGNTSFKLIKLFHVGI